MSEVIILGPAESPFLFYKEIVRYREKDVVS